MMNDYEQQLHNAWNRVTYNGATVRLAVQHPLEWYVGYYTASQKAVILISDSPVKNVESLKSIAFNCAQRQDGKYALAFILLSKEMEEVYITMCGDIIRFSSVESAPAKALIQVIGRYKQWIKLLEHQRSALMGASAQKGLIGELYYLKTRLESGMNEEEALIGWVGPEGADQDFQYTDGWHEIKATGISSSEVGISSIEQLDNDETGELIIVRIDKCADEKKGSITLRSMVQSIFPLLHSNYSAFEAYNAKLSKVGYMDLPEYDQQFYYISGKEIYSVDCDFPRLRRASLPSEVTQCNYSLSIASIEKWKK
jgi:hypothetical protein